jgi:hypothetical protein
MAKGLQSMAVTALNNLAMLVVGYYTVGYIPLIMPFVQPSICVPLRLILKKSLSSSFLLALFSTRTLASRRRFSSSRSICGVRWIFSDACMSRETCNSEDPTCGASLSALAASALPNVSFHRKGGSFSNFGSSTFLLIPPSSGNSSSKRDLVGVFERIAGVLDFVLRRGVVCLFALSNV